MDSSPQLIVMLTHNDQTVFNASSIFEKCKHSKAKFWGIKESPLPLNQMQELCTKMKACGKTTFLEVVAYTEEECLNGAKMAVKCGFDVLMGTLFYDSVNEFCQIHNQKYMPFVGKISNRPSILEGSIDEMIEQAHQYLEKGVYGFDLLGYRYTGNATELNKAFVSKVNAPVCIAGSVNCYQKLDELKDISPWAFTIGGGFFEHRFGEDFQMQIDTVCDYMRKP